ncbi:hypothetical protein QVD17_28545 [Tagetes erecta]|uniref:Uncharacterized protein n=1 Tax=Tagetes erecta TaxID=13708 RepID=A0AAD8KD17_TARER|nr:hypothetical protein QVD17_28545 [Tagetes erecta]
MFPDNTGKRSKAHLTKGRKIGQTLEMTDVGPFKDLSESSDLPKSNAMFDKTTLLTFASSIIVIRLGADGLPLPLDFGGSTTKIITTATRHSYLAGMSRSEDQVFLADDVRSADEDL